MPHSCLNRTECTSRGVPGWFHRRRRAEGGGRKAEGGGRKAAGGEPEVLEAEAGVSDSIFVLRSVAPEPGR